MLLVDDNMLPGQLKGHTQLKDPQYLSENLVDRSLTDRHVGKRKIVMVGLLSGFYRSGLSYFEPTLYILLPRFYGL